MSARKIYKYQIEIGANYIHMPEKLNIFAADIQGESLCVWATVELDGKESWRLIGVYGTGWKAPPTYAIHVDTIQSKGFVWHVWDLGCADNVPIIDLQGLPIETIVDPKTLAA